MDTYGSIWIHTDTYGPIWTHMDAYGYVWIHMDTYGYIWIHIWVHMDPYGSWIHRTIWIHMDPYGLVLTRVSGHIYIYIYIYGSQSGIILNIYIYISAFFLCIVLAQAARGFQPAPSHLALEEELEDNGGQSQSQGERWRCRQQEAGRLRLGQAARL